MEEYAQSHMETSGEGSGSGIAAHKALSASPIFQLCLTILQGVVTIPQLSARTVGTSFVSAAAWLGAFLTDVCTCSGGL